ncbi:MAG: 2-C-methyl-D-erythritol 4-phosphate cytidylyltransferase [Sphaerobacteraceae bacterium]|nr:MAG: 2-C-methyl-D-erythritol 4-phosphate cytidylyltransferase [Sphaerobacteraceae bacterium]
MTCGAVIPAAGRARRFGNADKTVIEIAGKPLLTWTIEALIAADALSEIVIVDNEDNQQAIAEIIAGIDAPIPVSATRGGAARMDSVRAGVDALTPECALVLIHDAARPLVTPELVRSSIAAADLLGAVISATPVTDTIKCVDGDLVSETVDRNLLVSVQTPQVFRREWLLNAYQQWPSDREATDEASILESAGYDVRTIPGAPENLKVTTAIDAIVAEALLSNRDAVS